MCLLTYLQRKNITYPLQNRLLRQKIGTIIAAAAAAALSGDKRCDFVPPNYLMYRAVDGRVLFFIITTVCVIWCGRKVQSENDSSDLALKVTVG